MQWPRPNNFLSVVFYPQEQEEEVKDTKQDTKSDIGRRMLTVHKGQDHKAQEQAGSLREKVQAHSKANRGAVTHALNSSWLEFLSCFTRTASCCKLTSGLGHG